MCLYNADSPGLSIMDLCMLQIHNAISRHRQVMGIVPAVSAKKILEKK